MGNNIWDELAGFYNGTSSSLDTALKNAIEAGRALEAEVVRLRRVLEHVADKCGYGWTTTTECDPQCDACRATEALKGQEVRDES